MDPTLGVIKTLSLGGGRDSPISQSLHQVSKELEESQKDTISPEPTIAMSADYSSSAPPPSDDVSSSDMFLKATALGCVLLGILAVRKFY